MTSRSRVMGASALVMVVAALVLGISACDPSPPQLLFSPGWDMAGKFYDFPFPSDLRVTADGRPDLTSFPDGNNKFARFYLDQFSEILNGFGLNGAIYFQSTQPLDATVFPTPEESTGPDASIFLINVDPGSPHLGERIPLLVDVSEREGKYRPKNLLALLPYPGFPMREATRYAAVVTTAVLDAEGRPLEPDPTFEKLKLGETGGDPFLEKALLLYEPVLDYLETAEGIGRETIAAATVFTTQDATSRYFRLRDHVAGLPSLGGPEVEAVGEQEEFWTIEGRYLTPVYQCGIPPYLSGGGDIAFDEAGEPVLQREEWAGFAVTIPKTLSQPEAGWPVVVFAHGTGGYAAHYLGRNGISVPASLSSQGFATVSFDQPLHGIRNPAAIDISYIFFNFVNLQAWLGNIWQAAADVVYLMRCLERWEFGPLDERLGFPVRFDPEKRMFMGHSQGATIGVPYLAVDDVVDGAVLSAPGGGAYYSLLYKRAPIDIPLLLEVALNVFGTGEFDIHHPLHTLAQTFIDPSDSISLGRYLVDEPAGASLDLFLTIGLKDHYVPPPMADALATAIGIDQTAPAGYPIEGLALRGRGVLDTPITGNLVGSAGEPVTGAITQYPEQSHFSIFYDRNAAKRYAVFLGSLADEGLARIE